MSTEVRAISTMRKQAEASLRDAERTEFKSCVGSLQYVSGGCRPDVAASTSLIQRGDLTLEELSAAYEVLSYLRDTADAGIRLKPIDLKNLCC